MKERQQSYDSALTVVKKNWEQKLRRSTLNSAGFNKQRYHKFSCTRTNNVSKWQSSAAIVTMVTGEQSLDAASAETVRVSLLNKSERGLYHYFLFLSRRKKKGEKKKKKKKQVVKTLSSNKGKGIKKKKRESRRRWHHQARTIHLALPANS
ncbi:uncharacterized protein DS421_11g336510 [Arachis hypogaea]|nr:uncharacterized protein DS421_11g336510 [Arachis hypogaea]